MISSALHFTCEVLNQFLNTRFNLGENKAVVNRLAGIDGSPVADNSDKVVLSLANIEESAVKRPITFVSKPVPEGLSNPSAGLHYAYVLVTANFGDYAEALKYLDAVLDFFELNHSLDAQSAPAIPSGISRLEFVMKNINLDQVQHIWSGIGVPYQPSMVYRMSINRAA